MNLQIIKAALFTPAGRGKWGLPIIFWGQPGIGKSAIIEAYGEALGLSVYTLSPAEQGEGAFGVIPVPDKSGEYIKYPIPEWANDFAKRKRGLLFLDEIQFASGTQCEKPLLRLARERAIGARFLPDTVRVIAAANPPEISGGLEMLEALENRFGHCNVVFDFDAWKAWVRSGANGHVAASIDPVKEEARVEAAFPSAYRMAWNLAIGFLETHQNLAAPKSSDPGWQNKRARPSPRTWEYAVRAQASAQIHALSASDTEEFYSMFIGIEAGAQYAAYIEKLDLPSPADALAGKWAHNPLRLDVTSIVLQSCAAYVTSRNVPADTKALWALLDSLCSDGLADMVIPIEEILVSAGMSTEDTAYSDLAEKVLTRTRRTLKTVKES